MGGRRDLSPIRPLHHLRLQSTFLLDRLSLFLQSTLEVLDSFFEQRSICVILDADRLQTITIREKNVIKNESNDK